MISHETCALPVGHSCGSIIGLFIDPQMGEAFQAAACGTLGILTVVCEFLHNFMSKNCGISCHRLPSLNFGYVTYIYLTHIYIYINVIYTMLDIMLNITSG